MKKINKLINYQCKKINLLNQGIKPEQIQNKKMNNYNNKFNKHNINI